MELMVAEHRAEVATGGCRRQGGVQVPDHCPVPHPFRSWHLLSFFIGMCILLCTQIVCKAMSQSERRVRKAWRVNDPVRKTRPSVVSFAHIRLSNHVFAAICLGLPIHPLFALLAGQNGLYSSPQLRTNTACIAAQLAHSRFQHRQNRHTRAFIPDRRPHSKWPQTPRAMGRFKSLCLWVPCSSMLVVSIHESCAKA